MGGDERRINHNDIFKKNRCLITSEKVKKTASNRTSHLYRPHRTTEPVSTPIIARKEPMVRQSSKLSSPRSTTVHRTALCATAGPAAGCSSWFGGPRTEKLVIGGRVGIPASSPCFFAHSPAPQHTLSVRCCASQLTVPSSGELVTTKTMGFTKEQRRRMEENRARAQARLREKRKA